MPPANPERTMRGGPNKTVDEGGAMEPGADLDTELGIEQRPDEPDLDPIEGEADDLERGLAAW